MRFILTLLISIFLQSTAFGYVNMLTINIAPETLQFHIKNPNGLITGYNNGSIQKQIQYLDYYLSAVDGAQNPPLSAFETYYTIDNHRVELPNPLITGQYVLVIYNNSGNVILSNVMIDIDYSEGQNYSVSHSALHLIYPNSTWTYEFTVPATPPAATAQLAPGGPSYASVPLIKVANSSDIIKDLTTAGQLGYIGNSKFVNELIKEVQEIEKERTEVRKPEEQTLRQAQGDKEKEHLTPAQKAIKEDKELLKEITEKYQRPEGNEFVKQEAYTVLKEDLDYIIGHIQ